MTPSSVIGVLVFSASGCSALASVDFSMSLAGHLRSKVFIQLEKRDKLGKNEAVEHKGPVKVTLVVPHNRTFHELKEETNSWIHTILASL